MQSNAVPAELFSGKLNKLTRPQHAPDNDLYLTNRVYMTILHAIRSQFTLP